MSHNYLFIIWDVGDISISRIKLVPEKKKFRIIGAQCLVGGGSYSIGTEIEKDSIYDERGVINKLFLEKWNEV